MILRITDGTDSVNLLSENGFFLKEWTPIRPLKKSGGIWQGSPLSDNTNMVLRNYDNITDVLTLTINNGNMDDTIYENRKLAHLLEKAEQYWTTTWQNEPVWIERQGACETKVGYAIIRSYQWEKDDNPFGSPFSTDALMDEIDIALVHGFWRSLPPGEDKCVQISGQQYAVTSDTDIFTPLDSADDVWYSKYPNGIFGFGILEGNHYLGAPRYYSANSYVRFRNITIPQGSEIVSAYISLKAAATESSTNCNVDIHVNDTDDAPQIVTVQQYISEVSKLPRNGVEWNEIEDWTINTWYTSPDIKNLIQTVVSRDGFTIGNDIGLFLQNTTTDWDAAWAETQPNGDADFYWKAVDSDGDGTNLIACVYNGRLWTSANSGVTWTERRPDGTDTDNNWYSVASDDDGSNLIAASISPGDLGIWTSSNSGVNWTLRQPAGVRDNFWVTVASDSDGSNLIAGSLNVGVPGLTGRLWTSADSGATWTERQPAGAVDKDWNCSASDSDGSFLVAGILTGRLWTSANSGANWTERQPAGAVDKDWVSADCDSDGSFIIVCTNQRIYTSSDSGVNWTEQTPAGNVDKNWTSVSCDSDGSELLACYNDGASGKVYTACDSGATWVERQPAGNVAKQWTTIASDSDGSNIIVGANSDRLYISDQNGTSRQYLTSDVGGGSEPQLEITYITSPYLNGRSETCDNEVFVTNKQDYSQLSHIYIYEDGVGFDANNYVLDNAFQLLPDPMSSGDMIYFGIDNSGLYPYSPFGNLVFDIDVVAATITDYTWQYYNGAAWITIPYLKDDTVGFTQTGVNNIGFDQPSDWAVVAVNGVTGFWIRFVATTVTASTTIPTQDNRYVYATQWPYFELDEDQIYGDVPAQAAIQYRIETTDSTLPVVNHIRRSITKLVIASRSVDRGADFTPFFNFSTDGTHNPSWVTAQIWSGGGTVTNSTVPYSGSGSKYAVTTPAALGRTKAGSFRFFIDNAYAKQYAGRFHVYARVKQLTGDPGDAEFRVVFNTWVFSFAITDYVSSPGVTDEDEWVLLDFGIVNTDIEQFRSGTETAFNFRIEFASVVQAVDMEFMDIVLVPVDEIYYDTEDADRFVSETDQIIDFSDVYHIFIDNLVEKRNFSIAMLTLGDSPLSTGGDWYVSRTLRTISSKPYEYQVGVKQRIFTLAATWDLNEELYYSSPEVVLRAQTVCVERYLGMIGA